MPLCYLTEQECTLYIPKKSCQNAAELPQRGLVSIGLIHIWLIQREDPLTVSGFGSELCV